MKHYPANTVEAEAVIIARIAETAFRATLPNGKETIAFVEKKNAHLRDLLQKDSRVKVSICPADFGRARIDEILGN